jgi:hypothetical protein
LYYKDQREKSGLPCSGTLEENSAAPMLKLTHQHMTLKNTASYFRLTISGIIHRYFIGLGIVQGSDRSTLVALFQSGAHRPKF